jgi:predicted DNA-binding protein (UPF0251 family)
MVPACRREAPVGRVTLLPEEIEAIKLADLLGLEQEEVAASMGVSRKTAWKDLHSARKKIADAVVNGKILQVESCEAAGDRGCGMRRRRGRENNDEEARCGQAP